MTRLPQTLVGSLSRWLVHEASRLPDVGAIIQRLAEQLIQNGVPIDRATAHFKILHPLYVGVTRVWTPEEGLRMMRPEHGGDTAQEFRRSPLEYVRSVNDWIDIRLDRDQSLDLAIFRDLRAAGFTHYMMAPLRFSDGSIEAASFATRRAGGFSSEEQNLLRALAGPLALVVELKRLRIMSASMLAEYVGRDPAERILSGTVQRGDLVHIRAALMFTDMIGFTAMTQRESPEEVVRRLNEYFEAVDVAIRRHDGEILKFVGDGVFAIFPERKKDAACRAFAAARDCLREPPHPLRVALHEGEIAYGNVGSGERLDFTAIGPDVNLLNRLLELGRAENRPLVFSREIADAIDTPVRSLGRHRSRGFEHAVEIFEAG